MGIRLSCKHSYTELLHFSAKSLLPIGFHVYVCIHAGSVVLVSSDKLLRFTPHRTRRVQDAPGATPARWAGRRPLRPMSARAARSWPLWTRKARTTSSTTPAAPIAARHAPSLSCLARSRGALAGCQHAKPFAPRSCERFALPVPAACLHRNPISARTYGHLVGCVWCGGVFGR